MANEDKNISYLNKDFGAFKTELQQYAKTYFPETYNDFSEATPGNMFIEMASYVGDVMSFYLDTQVQENFLLYAKEKENLYAQAYVMGYRPKASYASNTTVDIYQLMPSTSSDGGVTFKPDYTTYGILVPTNTTITSLSTGVNFLTTQQVDFRDTGSTEITFVDSNYFLFKKSVPAISAEIKETTINVGANQKFAIANITDNNILQILNVTGSGGQQWYEVPYLAQSSIFKPIANPSYSTDQVPYLLQLQNTPRRFVSRILSNNTLQLEFGAGLSSNKSDTQIIPTPSNIQAGAVPGISLLTNNYNEAGTFFTQEYGLVPNGDLTVKYLVGGGIESNLPANDLTTINTSGITFPGGGGALNNSILQSIVSNNPNPSSGGRNGDTSDEIRQNALYAYSTQLRAVTKDDYIVRAMSMPSDYGTVAKAYISQDLNINPQETVAHTNSSNPLALDLYILSYNSNKQLTASPPTLKQNLVTYLNQYRMVTDAINIKDAYYINIGLNFDITILSGYSNKDIITNCINVLKDHFNIDKWQINQPITLSDIQSRLLQIRGVQSVVKLEIVNKQDPTGNNYSQYGYDIVGATKNGNVYPSLDPAIFEIRFPDVDIQGRVVVS
jgi:hypothetical protein